MDSERLRSSLIAVARKTRVSEEVPYTFEKRVMARIAGGSPEDVLSLWGAALWKGAAACTVITAVCVALSLWTVSSNGDSETDPFEAVVLAGADQMTETW
jgi:hypothetical protein